MWHGFLEGIGFGFPIGVVLFMVIMGLLLLSVQRAVSYIVDKEDF